jgi:hypothetical protein
VARRPVPAQADGRVLLYTTASENAKVHTGRPERLSGSAHTLTIAIGRITKEAARAAFGDAFKGGADAANALTDVALFAAVVQPRTTGFRFGFDQLCNIGFAITPIARATVMVHVLEPDGRIQLKRTCESGEVAGPAYVFNGSPIEEIGKVAHEAIYRALVRARDDLFAQAPRAATK